MRLHLEREQILFKFPIDFAVRLLVTNGCRRSWHLEISFFFSTLFLVRFSDLNHSAGMLDLGCYLRWQQILGCLEETLITCFVL